MSHHEDHALDVGLVTPLPPEPGGVATIADWLITYSTKIGCKYSIFHLNRPDAFSGGRLGFGVILLQLKQLAAFLRWSLSSPPTVHQMVAATITGLVRDLLYFFILRVQGRAVIVHIQVVKPHLGWWRMLMGLLMRCRPETLVVPSRHTAASIPTGTARVSVIPNPIRPLEQACPDSPASRTPELFDGTESCRIAFVGDMGHRKGSLRVLSALADANERGCNAVAVFAGRAENGDVLAEHERLIADRKLQDTVRLAGALEATELSRLYAWADVFVLPSCQEGVPLAMIEAMAHRLAPIVTPVGGIPEFVTDQSTAIIVPPLDISALSAAIFDLATDVEKRTRISMAAQEYVASTLSPDRIASLWTAAYRAAAGGAS